MTARDNKLTRDRERIIPALNKLLARDAVLASYEAQYELMEQHQLTPGELEYALQSLDPAPLGEGEEMLVLTVNEAVG